MSKLIKGYVESYRSMHRQCTANNMDTNIGILSVVYDIERNMVPFALDKPKDHQIAKFVNELSDISRMYADTQQLRDKISNCVKDFLNQLE